MNQTKAKKKKKSLVAAPSQTLGELASPNFPACIPKANYRADFLSGQMHTWTVISRTLRRLTTTPITLPRNWGISKIAQIGHFLDPRYIALGKEMHWTFSAIINTLEWVNSLNLSQMLWFFRRRGWRPWKDTGNQIWQLW